jgi:hypothetical protein
MSIGMVVFGLVLIVLGAVCAVIVRGKLASKAVDVQYMKATSLKDLKQVFDEMGSSGVAGNLRQYVELQGVSASAKPPKTPYSVREVAYYQAQLIQVFEATEFYKDENGNQQRRTVRKEETISDEKSVEPLLLKDPGTGETVAIDLQQGGMQLDLMEGSDRFEPVDNMRNYGFFSAFTPRQIGDRTLGYRMVERIIPLAQPLYVLGEAYLRNGDIFIGKPGDKKKSYIVSTKSEGQIAKEARRGSAVALAGGILLGVAGIAVTIYGLFAK